MPRTHIHLTEQQLKQIQGEVERTGLKQSEVVRRIIDKGLEPDYYKGTSILDSVETSIPDIESSGKNKIVIRPYSFKVNIDLYGCKIFTEYDNGDRIKLSFSPTGPFKRYIEKNPLLIGDIKAGQGGTIFVRSTDKVGQAGEIRFEGGEL